MGVVLFYSGIFVLNNPDAQLLTRAVAIHEGMYSYVSSAASNQ